MEIRLENPPNRQNHSSHVSKTKSSLFHEHKPNFLKMPLIIRETNTKSEGYHIINSLLPGDFHCNNKHCKS